MAILCCAAKNSLHGTIWKSKVCTRSVHKCTPQETSAENSGTNGINFFALCTNSICGTRSWQRKEPLELRDKSSISVRNFLKSFRMEKHYRGLCSIWTCLRHSAGVTQATVVCPGPGAAWAPVGGLSSKIVILSFIIWYCSDYLPLELLTPLVSLIPVVNFPPVSTSPPVNLPPVYSWSRWNER